MYFRKLSLVFASFQNMEWFNRYGHYTFIMFIRSYSERNYNIFVRHCGLRLIKVTLFALFPAIISIIFSCWG